MGVGRRTDAAEPTALTLFERRDQPPTARPSRIRAAALLVCLLAAGCGGGTTPVPDTQRGGDTAVSGGTAVIGSISDVDSWNEYISQGGFAGGLLRRVFLRLAVERGAGNQDPEDYEPLLAESWEFSDDRRSLTFRLRDTVWSDGQPVTADDVRFTWQAQTSDEVPWIAASSKERITDVEVLDPRTVRFHFDSAYPYQFVDAVEGGIIPAHVHGNVPFHRWVTHDWSQHRIASGPFVLDSHARGQEITLVRNPRYFREGHPRLDRVVVRIVPDQLNLVTQLSTGDIDYLEGIPPRNAHRLAGERDVEVLPFDFPQYDFLGWNGAKPPFDSKKFRLAITLALDREALVEDLLFDYGSVAASPVPSSWWGANRSIRPWAHDATRARVLLGELGYAARAPDGTMGPGRPLELEIITNSGNQLREDMLVKIQEQLSRLGVSVEVRALESGAMRAEITAGRFDVYLGGWTFFGKVDLKSLFHSDLMPPRGLNVVRYRSPEADRLLDRVERAVSTAEMKADLDALQRLFHEDLPYTLLYEKKRIAAYRVRLRGVTIEVPSDPLARLEDYWIDPDAR